MKIIISIFFINLALLSLAPKVLAQAKSSIPSDTCCTLANPWTPPILGSGAGLAVDQSRGRVYATDGISGKIIALNYDGSTVTAFGGGFVSLPSAFGVAVGKGAYDGVYALPRDPSSPATITKYDAGGNIVWAAPGAWGGGTERCICVDDWGNLYVATDPDQIFVLDSTGTQKAVITTSGSWGPLAYPTGLVMVGLNLYVADSVNNRIIQLVESGANSYSYIPTKAVTLSIMPYGITADLTGHFFVAASDMNGYAAFDENFSQLTQWCSLSQLSGAFGIALDETGTIYVEAGGSHTVGKMQACFSQSPPFYYGNNPPKDGECFVYPSPVKGDHGSLSYRMAETGRIELKIWNEKAELVSDVTDQKSAGIQATSFTTSAFASGVYFYSVILTYDSGKVTTIKPRKFAVIH